jgi:hypothetical protein
MEFFFKRLEKYIDVRPSADMTDIIVKIMVEVLTILGIVTKEVKQGRTSMSFIVDPSLKTELSAERYLKKLVGRKDVENALQRLDKLTQEEARMAAVEALIIARGIDVKVQSVDCKVQVDDHKVGSVIEGELYLRHWSRIGPHHLLG